MKLYGVLLSPFVRKAALALDFKGIAFESEPTMPGDPAPEFRAISPLGKVPVLEHEDFTVPDTSVILRYLDRVQPAPALYPEDAREEARTLWLEEYADSRLVEVCAGLFRERLLHPRMLNTPTNEDVVRDLLTESMPTCLDYLESQIADGTAYLVGDQLTAADISVVTCFVQSRYAGFEVDGGSHPKLRAYLDGAFASDLVTRRLEAEAAASPPGLLD